MPTGSKLRGKGTEGRKQHACLASVLKGTVEVSLVFQQHFDGLTLQAKLLVDVKGLLKHLVAHRNLTDSRAIKVVKTVDVVLDPALVSLHKSTNKH